METRNVLEQVKAGKISVEEAERFLMKSMDLPSWIPTGRSGPGSRK